MRSALSAQPTQRFIQNSRTANKLHLHPISISSKNNFTNHFGRRIFNLIVKASKLPTSVIYSSRSKLWRFITLWRQLLLNRLSTYTDAKLAAVNRRTREFERRLRVFTHSVHDMTHGDENSYFSDLIVLARNRHSFIYHRHLIKIKTILFVN